MSMMKREYENFLLKEEIENECDADRYHYEMDMQTRVADPATSNLRVITDTAFNFVQQHKDTLEQLKGFDALDNAINKCSDFIFDLQHKREEELHDGLSA